ncbi:30S ribosome-binding factor RbfA [Tepidimicrobium xylanilyticum]|uniref:Ribosome-binding factor A n=1 Tax=Tepidimicrobium xylanilyticum TaxID=1123352 RepID=A0A1H2YC45_9FIRM|nr:30S ribosome-binding factor RbfA [Tepidimicrobium xylanilyticum]GMG97095.1 ribosome-binding factor A [Tepidimicrobium xylanilyticum]SDX02398.1 ribosome-binding factor A [Tepidimicrobium xylanilyticum]
MNPKRLNRISEEIKKVVSELISREIKDPRVNPMTSIVDVKVTNDLSYANIYVSVLGDKEAKNDTITGLNNAKGFIRKEMGRRIDLRHVPEINFHLDESIEQGLYISKLIDEVSKENRIRRGDENE